MAIGMEFIFNRTPVITVLSLEQDGLGCWKKTLYQCLTLRNAEMIRDAAVLAGYRQWPIEQ